MREVIDHLEGHAIDKTIKIKGLRVPEVISFIGRDMDKGKLGVKIISAIRLDNGEYQSDPNKKTILNESLVGQLLSDTFTIKDTDNNDVEISGVEIMKSLRQIVLAIWAGNYKELEEPEELEEPDIGE
jgi:hypothetical protein